MRIFVRFQERVRIVAIACGLLAFHPAVAKDAPTVAQFRRDIAPILSEHCYDCHGDGENKGKVTLDQFTSEDALLRNHDLWWRVLKNVRAGLMPPAKKPRLSSAELQHLERWIKEQAFGLDPAHPDPGRVTIRRLNRVEYRNTIRDLMGYDFKVEEELPPDDTGYGFDNIGDVLSISPLLLEKYMHAAQMITAAAVPRVARVIAETNIPGVAFRAADGHDQTGERLTFYAETVVTNAFFARHPGSYRLALDVDVLGQFDFDPGRCRVVLQADGRELFQHEFGWQNGRKFHFDFGASWKAGPHALSIEVHPLTPVEQRKNSLDLRIAAVRVQGPTDDKFAVRPKNFALFFTRDVPTSAAERRAYAAEVLRRFATRAYRRPVDERTVERLVALAESVYSEPDQRFEDGIAQAMVPVLAAPRFLFRVEETESTNERSAPVDEYALASRLSYFLWSTMPDAQLFELASRHQLRAHLGRELRRMLADSRAGALVDNFVGQWLQVRDVEGIDINARLVLARDRGEEKELERIRREFLQQRQRRKPVDPATLTPEQRAELEQQRERRRRLFRPTVELDGPLRTAMRRETEMLFAHIVRDDRSVLDLLDSDYTFLNEKLAKHYGITNVTGPEMRLVPLPPDSARGGVLTEGAVLVVTSNPTRTSPVKRGLFVLDNLLGLPPPPPPADIPQLEESEKVFKDREPTLRETLAVHREKPLCSSCHNRMDPLGLALENFNALGMWRAEERGQRIEASGRLITGEAFADIRELKRVLVTKHRADFYRCLTEKLLTYALGRGLEYYDVQAVDEIVARLERENGRCSALLTGIIESAPFQQRRTTGAAERDKLAEQRAEVRKP